MLKFDIVSDMFSCRTCSRRRESLRNAYSGRVWRRLTVRGESWSRREPRGGREARWTRVSLRRDGGGLARARVRAARAPARPPHAIDTACRPLHRAHPASPRARHAAARSTQPLHPFTPT